MGLTRRRGVPVGWALISRMPGPLLARCGSSSPRPVADPAFKQALEKVRVVPDYREGDEFKRFFDADHKRMAVIMKKIGKM